VQIVAPVGPLHLTAAFVNGTGRASNDVTGQVDQLYRASWQSTDKTLSIGASDYVGKVSASTLGGTLISEAGTTTTSATAAAIGKKELIGADAQYANPNGLFVNAEMETGEYDALSAIGLGGATAMYSVNSIIAPGNKVFGYYAQGGYVLGNTGAHPLTLAAGYDQLRRSISGLHLVTPQGIAHSGSNWDDDNWGGGVLYALDSNTRLRFWYEQPTNVAHLLKQAYPNNYGLFTGEVQVKF
jgi:hypothetical protein